MFNLAVASLLVGQAVAFVNNNAKPYRLQPVRENFFLDIAEDPAINTPKQIFGEVAYKSFVEDYKPDALLVGGPKYDIIERVRQLKLLKLTAESGLIEVLESKGLTLSKLEALLPLADDLALLPLANKNKELILNLAPLIIEPAPALIPVAVNLLKTPPSNFLAAGFALLGLGAYEATDSFLLGAPLILLGIPLAVLGTVLNTVDSFLGGAVPKVTPVKVDTTSSTATTTSAPKAKGSRPTVQARPVVAAKAAAAPVAKAAAPVVAAKATAPAVKAPAAKASAAPKAAAPKAKASAAPRVAAAAAGGSQNGKRKVVKVSTR